ncbi:hypothetical protein ACSHWG_05405 [Leucobacter sp. Z1108]|uniref:hypothetical protein n=1 Tax=Leucobacter sp. Z1108 TaxID=3439066 RepID=UPI003F34DAB0
MKIVVNSAAESTPIQLLDPENFREFSVILASSEPIEALNDHIQSIGRLEGEGHLFVDKNALIELAGNLGTSAAWLENLEAMTTFAESKGWTDASGAIRAHIERI